MFDASGPSIIDLSGSNRPNKTGTWLLIKCSFQNGPFSTKNMFFNLKNAFTVVNWAVFKCRFDMKISKNTDNNIVYFVKET